MPDPLAHLFELLELCGSDVVGEREAVLLYMEEFGQSPAVTPPPHTE